MFLGGPWAALPSHRVLPEHHISAETGAILVQALERERFQEAFISEREDGGGEEGRDEGGTQGRPAVPGGPGGADGDTG